VQPDHDAIISELHDLAEATDGAAATIADVSIRARLRQIATEVRDMAQGDSGTQCRDWSHPFEDRDIPELRLLA